MDWGSTVRLSTRGLRQLSGKGAGCNGLNTLTRTSKFVSRRCQQALRCRQGVLVSMSEEGEAGEKLRRGGGELAASKEEKGVRRGKTCLPFLGGCLAYFSEKGAAPAGWAQGASAPKNSARQPPEPAYLHALINCLPPSYSCLCTAAFLLFDLQFCPDTPNVRQRCASKPTPVLAADWQRRPARPW